VKVELEKRIKVNTEAGGDYCPLLTGTADAENALHNVEGSCTLRDRREANKGILGSATDASNHPNFRNVEGIDVDPAEGVSGKMIHRKEEDIAKIVLRRIRRQIRDCRESERTLGDSVIDIGDGNNWPKRESTSSAGETAWSSWLLRTGSCVSCNIVDGMRWWRIAEDALKTGEECGGELRSGWPTIDALSGLL
jgi:hypothetical protein